jgi:hypothetical protein
MHTHEWSTNYQVALWVRGWTPLEKTTSNESTFAIFANACELDREGRKSITRLRTTVEAVLRQISLPEKFVKLGATQLASFALDRVP